jgi:hypothetical protein
MPVDLWPVMQHRMAATHARQVAGRSPSPENPELLRDVGRGPPSGARPHARSRPRRRPARATGTGAGTGRRSRRPSSSSSRRRASRSPGATASSSGSTTCPSGCCRPPCWPLPTPSRRRPTASWSAAPRCRHGVATSSACATTTSSASASTERRDLDDLLPEAFAVVPRGRQAGDRPAPLRRAAHGRRRAALRLDRRDEDRRGQDARLDAAGVPQRARPARACTSSRSTTTWPSSTPSGWAASTGSSASTVGVILPGDDDPDRAQARPVRLRHHLRHQQRVRLRLPARQHGDVARPRTRCSAATLRDRRRGRLDPHRRGPHAADHLRPRRRRRQALLPSSPRSSAA